MKRIATLFLMCSLMMFNGQSFATGTDTEERSEQMLGDAIERLKDQKPWVLKNVGTLIGLMLGGFVAGLGIDIFNKHQSPILAMLGFFGAYISSIFLLVGSSTQDVRYVQNFERALWRDHCIKNLKISSTKDDAVAFANHNFNNITPLYSAWTYLNDVHNKISTLSNDVKRARLQVISEKTAQKFGLLVETIDLTLYAIKNYMQHLASHDDFEGQKAKYVKVEEFEVINQERKALRYRF